MFWFLVQSGSLPKTHVFYEEVKAFTSKALGWLVPPTADFQSTCRSLTSWLQSNQFLHGKGATHFFNGIGGDGQGHLAEMAMSTEEWIKCHNFAGVSPRSLRDRSFITSQGGGGGGFGGGYNFKTSPFGGGLIFLW